jgi:hypothetical protein
VAIAEASLKLVSENIVTPERRTYLNIEGISAVEETEQLDSILMAKNPRACYACAIGTLMCGAALLFDNITTKDAFNWKNIVRYLKRNGFSLKEIAKIEYALEQSNEVGIGIADSSDVDEFEELVLSSEEKTDVRKYIYDMDLAYAEANFVVTHLLTYIIEHDGNLPF